MRGIRDVLFVKIQFLGKVEESQFLGKVETLRKVEEIKQRLFHHLALDVNHRPKN
jgi:hypothetical protein